LIDVGSITSENCTEDDWVKVSEEIGNACLNYGFFYIKNHGVAANLISDMFKMCTNFFNEPEEEKNKILMKYAGKDFRGYFKLGGELTSNRPDWKEGLYFGAEVPPDHEDASKPMHGPNLWHPKYPEMQKLIIEYMDRCTALGHVLMEAVARSLQLPPKFFFEKYTKNPFIPFRIFYYPKDETGKHEDDQSERWGVGQHTDYGVLTLVAQDEVGGLQVRNKSNDGWIEATPIKDTFVVNIGECLDIWTGGKYKATVHRVKNIANISRLSAPFFFDPSFDCIIEPPQVETDSSSPWTKPFKYGSYIHNKVLRNFPELAKQLNADVFSEHQIILDSDK